MSIHTKLLIFSITYILTFVVSTASHQTQIDINSVELHIKKFDTIIRIIKKTEDNKSELSSLSVQSGDYLYQVPYQELTKIGTNFDLSSVRLLATVAVSGEKVHDLKDFGISISYGDITANYIGDFEIHSTNEVQFFFSKGELINRIRSVSLGDSKSSWKIYSKEAEQGEIEVEIIKGIKNPLGRETIEN